MRARAIIKTTIFHKTVGEYVVPVTKLVFLRKSKDTAVCLQPEILGRQPYPLPESVRDGASKALCRLFQHDTGLGYGLFVHATWMGKTDRSLEREKSCLRVGQPNKAVGVELHMTEIIKVSAVDQFIKGAELGAGGGEKLLAEIEHGN